VYEVAGYLEDWSVESEDCFLRLVKDHKAETLLPIIEAHVRPWAHK
jgi:hypothetical protein